MLNKDLAICIQAADFSETSQILTFFTKTNGKIKAIAKGSKRPKSPFDGPVEIFSYGSIVFSDSAREKLATLTEFEQQQSFTHLGNNLFVLHCCLFATELLNSLTNDYDPHPQLFDSFLQFLQNTNEHRDTILLLILFQLTLLKEIGLMPILSYCVNCKTRPVLSAVEGYEVRDARCEIYFSSSANGFVCRDCEESFPDKIRISKDAAVALNNLKFIAASDVKTLNEIEKILIHHFTEILGRPPKMAKYILKT